MRNYLFKLFDFLVGLYYKNYYIYKGVSIPDDTILDIKSVFINGKNIEIGQYCYIGPFAYINGVGDVVIKSGTLVGPYVKILSGTHNFRSDISIPYDSVVLKGKVLIEENVWIGSGVTILPGVSIGEGSIVGAGTIITKDVEPYSIVVGNPARVIGYRDVDRYNKLKDENAVYLKIKRNGRKK